MIQPTRRNRAIATIQNCDVRMRSHVLARTGSARSRPSATAGRESMGDLFVAEREPRGKRASILGFANIAALGLTSSTLCNPGPSVLKTCGGRWLTPTAFPADLSYNVANRGNPMGWLQNKFEKNFMISTVDYVFNWARKSAVWPMTFGLACCAIEMIASSTARFDIARFGSEVFRPSPRQSDLMIVAGTVTLKMAPVVKRIYDQMPDPKWVISMGACSSVGGPFNTYAVLQGVDKIVPVDVYVIGCPPRPENLFYALLKLQDKIDTMTLAKKPTEVRLEENMVENFKRQVMIAQTLQPK